MASNDRNQTEIVDTLRALGCVVDVVSGLPDLGYDLIVQIAAAATARQRTTVQIAN